MKERNEGQEKIDAILKKQIMEILQNILQNNKIEIL